MGSSIEDFLKEEGIFEEAQAQAVKESCRMATSRGDENAEDFQERAAAIVGRRVSIELL